MAKYQVDFRVVETSVTHRRIEIEAASEREARNAYFRPDDEFYGEIIGQKSEASDRYLTSITKLEEV